MNICITILLILLIFVIIFLINVIIGGMLMKHWLAACCAAVFAVTAVSSSALVSTAQNPIAQNVYTSDPAPMVYGNTFFMYTGHDADGADYYTMPDWKCYSSTDMQNWTDHGTILSWDDFSWAEKDTAWAAQCIERNGKFYMYVTLVPAETGGRAIGVAVADSPTGPFKDALGKPLCGPNWDFIDPTVFIDDDGQAYLYFGNPNPYYVRLNEDMISYDGEITKVQMTTESFGTDPAGDGTAYTEGPWLTKRGDLYYLLYAANGIPENIAYSTAPTPTGPWTYRGVIMPTEGRSFTNHCGVVDYKGHSYFAYHNGALEGGNGFQRSAAVEEFTYNPDGTFPTIKMTEAGPAQLEYVDPFQKQEAEMMSWSQGIETETCSAGGLDVANIENGDYVKVSGVDFGDGADTFTASIASATQGGTIEIRLDSVDGTLAGTCQVPATNGWQTWKEVSCDVSVSGLHDVYFVYQGGSGYLFNVDWWQFAGAGGSFDTYAAGDVDHDGAVDVFDLALAKYGVKNGFTDKAAEQAADVDRSGKAETADILQIQNFILAKTDSFFTVTPDGPDEPDIPDPWDTYVETASPEMQRFYADAIYQFGNTSRLVEKIQKAQNGENVTLAYIGGSITEGGRTDTCYVSRSAKYFADTFGTGNNVSFINAGLSGTSSVVGLMRAQKDILDAAPDIIFIEFSVNDHPEMIYKKGYESLVKRCLSQPGAPAVVLIINRAKGGYSMQEQMAAIGEHYDLPVISMDNALTKAFNSGLLTVDDYYTDEYHPHEQGSALISDSIAYFYRQALKTENQTGSYTMPTDAVYGTEYSDGTIVPLDSLKDFKTGSFAQSTPGYASLPYTLKHSAWGGSDPITFTAQGKGVFIVYSAKQDNSFGDLNVTVNGQQTTISGNKLYAWGGPEADVAYMQNETGTLEVSIHVADAGSEFTIWGIGIVP